MAESIMGGNFSQLNDFYLLEKKLEIILDTNGKKVSGELNSIKAMLVKLNEDLLQLKSQLGSSSAPRSEPVVGNEPTARAEPATVNAQNKPSEVISNDFEGFRLIPNNTPPNPARDSPVKPRFGDYKSDDVPIEKFFYFGNKRR